MPDKEGDAVTEGMRWVTTALSTSADNFAQTTRQITELAFANLSAPFHWVEPPETQAPSSRKVH